MKIVADCDIPYLAGVFEPYASVCYLKGASIAPADVEEADALIVRTRTHCNEALLGDSKVRFIASATIGSDHIDLEFCRRRGIGVATSIGCNARGVLQWMAASLALFEERFGLSPARTTLGVVGVGHVGRLVREYALSWGFRVLCSDPPRERAEGLDAGEGFLPLTELVPQVDILTLHTPLTRSGDDATFHLVDRDLLASLKPGAVLVDAARGEIVEPEALAEAVVSGRCRAAIDTWNDEPSIDRRVLARAAVATPHIAGYSAQGKAMGTAMAVQAVATRFGLPLADWFPSDPTLRSHPAAISWKEMKRTIRSRFDIEAETRLLQRHPERFEERRNAYPYRQEYF